MGTDKRDISRRLKRYEVENGVETGIRDEGTKRPIQVVRTWVPRQPPMVGTIDGNGGEGSTSHPPPLPHISSHSKPPPCSIRS
ncbi:hypothetical protein L1887_31332 [Cichorium endivia]|nr:hypothetical protein L1887_31332 [Cichorium endivia]